MAIDNIDGTVAMEQLPGVYAEALRLRAAGLTWHEIGRRVGVEPEAMDTLLRLAEAKLAGAWACH